jgi:hypothetical protein
MLDFFSSLAPNERSEQGKCCIMRRRNLFILFIGVSANVFGGQALAAGKLYYGSRAGMQVSVVGVENLGTERAVIHIEHRPEDARKFCIEYANDRSKKCVEKTIEETLLNNKLTGNCKTGAFTSLWGDMVTFAGERRGKGGSMSTKYRIMKDGSELDGSSASGYGVYLGQFKALCPNIGIVDE